MHFFAEEEETKPGGGRKKVRINPKRKGEP